MTRQCATAVMLIALLAAAAVGCIEESSTASPNSDQGYLYIGLEQPLAVDWQAEILVRGPAGDGEHCDETRGCYPDHHRLEMQDVSSTDPDVVEVVDFEPASYGEADAVRVELDVVGEGDAKLEFAFSVPGASPEESADGTDEELPQQNEDDDSEAGENSEVIYDSYSVFAREVAGMRLSRILDDIEAHGPYNRCPETSAGAYLMENVNEYSVRLRFARYDAEGRLLRGSGDFPVEIDPEEAVEVTEFDGARHTVTISPNHYGPVEMTPESGGNSLKAHFVSLADVSQMDVTVYELDHHGGRMGEAANMSAERLYEVEAMPRMEGDIPICGGQIETSVQSTTPAICEYVGVVETTGNPAVAARHGGECRLQVALERGSSAPELVEEHSFSVHYDW